MISQQRLMFLRFEDVLDRIQEELNLIQDALHELGDGDDSDLRDLGEGKWHLRLHDYRNVREWIADITKTAEARQGELHKRQERVWKLRQQWHTYLDRLEWEKERAA
jgi:hypothetical protein